VFLAAIEPAVRPLTAQELFVYNILVSALLVGSILVFARLFRRLATNGPQVRSDLMGLPEMFAGAVILGLFALSLIARFFVKPDGAPNPAVENVPLEKLLLSNMANAALPALAIIFLVIARGGHLRTFYGLGKVNVLRAMAMGFCLAVLATPLTIAARALTVWATRSQEAPQALVRKFQSAVGGDELQLIGLIALSACVIAPICEELLFRGTFYPLLSRGLGRGLAAFVSALFFALVHDTYTDIPSLTLLALCFTLAYEATGSLLVPIFMHMAFNSISLLVMWWQIRQGLTP
jgi:hypothetical protein